MVAPISYAERARRAQTIRSPIAVPPPHPALFPPSVVVVGGGGSTSNASAASTAPSSGAVSTSVSATTDDTSTFSIVFTPHSLSPVPAPKGQQVPRPAANTPATPPAAGKAPSSQLAAEALSIVASHTAAGPKPAATVNVWSQRIERMAAARAAAAAAAVPAPMAHTPSTSSASLHPATTPSVKDAPEQQAPVADSAAAGTPIPSSPPVSTSNSGSPSVTVQPPPASSERVPEQQTTPDVWPEVGKSSVATSISADSLRPSESAHTTYEEGADDTQDKAPKSNTKIKSKSKWVPIPAAELQAAADAAIAARKPGGPNGGQRKGNRSTHNSNNTTDVNNTNANNSANNTPRSHSGRTSAAQSRTHSAQNSPRATRGRRLPIEDVANAPGGLSADAGPSTQPRPPPQAAQYQHPSQSQYLPSPHYPMPGHTLTPELIAAYPLPGLGPGAPAAYQQQPRHQSHPMQPAGPPSPSAHAFQVSAPPFYPQQGRMPPPPPLGDASPYPPPPGPYGPPMYPMYAPPGFAYGPWQGHGPTPEPGFAYGPPPPPPQQPAPYLPLEYSERQTSVAPMSVSAGVPSSSAVPAPIPVLRVDVAPKGSGGVEETGEVAPSATASALREKMVFGSIQSAGVVNGHAAGGANGVGIENEALASNGLEKDRQAPVDENEAQGAEGAAAVAKDGKAKGGKTKSASGKESKDGGSNRLTGKGYTTALDDAQVVAIPAVQASQSMQAEIKWKFGTASSTPPVQREIVLPPSDEAQTGPQQTFGEAPVSPVQDASLLHASSTMPAISTAHLDAGGLDPRGSASFAHLPPPLPVHEAPPVPDAGQAGILPIEPDSDLVVKDYGYGFGAASGSGYPPPPQWREEALNGQAAAALADETLGGIEAGPSHGYAPPAPREHGYGRGGHGPEGPPPSGRGGRRGGAYGPGRGYGGPERGGYSGRRGRGTNGYSRGYGRGYPRSGGGGGGGAPPHRTPPFTVTPPQHMIPLSPMSEHHQPIPYYPPPPPPPRQIPPYLAPPNGFDRYVPPPPQQQQQQQLPPPANGAHVPHVAPPVPVPLSPISFPLDPTRYYLLGQLEYYLSPQNMAQDFFLRQQMDSRGWIAISLIASFNRVQQLTMDGQLVRDVLTLSSLVQVRGNMVRMGGWERYVLPDAAPSNVEDQPLPQAYQNMGPYQEDLGGEHHPQQAYPQNYQAPHPDQQHDVSYAAPWPVEQQQSREAHAPLINGHPPNTAVPHVGGGHDEHNYDDEEEEEVVFVMGQDVGRWSPERVVV